MTLAALLTTVSVADRLLLRAGVKLYCTVQLWPAVNAVVAAHVPLRNMFGYSTRVRSLSEGRATFSMQFHSYDTLQS